MEKQWQWASATRVKIGRTDDPEVLLGQLLPGYSNDEAVCLLVDTGGRIGLKKVNRTVEALLRFSKPHWRLALILECNEYWSVPASVWTLVNLEQLRLEYNNLDTLSPDIAKLVKLKKLCIGVNQFEDFPEAVCQLEQLEQLFVSYCRLSVLPASFASLRHLRHLALTSNKFAEFPEVICELRKLTMLHLNGNKLSSLPHSFANLRELRELDISRNCFKKFPTVLCQLSKLTILKIYSNGMRELPLAFTKLTKLSFLEVCMNEFTSIPLFLGDLPQLSNLNATYGNPLQGPQHGLEDVGLLYYLQKRREIVRLTAIITGGFVDPIETAWARFLVRGLYDPRLFLFIFDFACGLFIDEPRKRGRFE